jgi:hypothetical protein
MVASAAAAEVDTGSTLAATATGGSSDAPADPVPIVTKPPPNIEHANINVANL